MGFEVKIIGKILKKYIIISKNIVEMVRIISLISRELLYHHDKQSIALHPVNGWQQCNLHLAVHIKIVKACSRKSQRAPAQAFVTTTTL